MACSNAQQENVSEYFGLPSKIIFDKRTKLEGKTKADILEGHIGGLICDREEDKTKKWLKPMVQKIADYHARKVRETPLLAFVGQDLKVSKHNRFGVQDLINSVVVVLAIG